MDDATLQSEGWITEEGVLAPEYDAAQAHWGGDWRMPKDADIRALTNNCDWTRTELNGVNGYLVSGRGDYVNNSIFLPTSGYGGFGDGTSLENAGQYGLFWTSDPESENSERARRLVCYADNYVYGGGSDKRFYGFSVRPVRAPAE